MKFFSGVLLASLTFTAAYIPVPRRDVSQSQNANPPQRKDITTMGKEEFSLYILAMQQWQKAQPSEIGGYFQVCGIHGAPHQYWDDSGSYQANTRQGNKGGGYCFHGTKDFYLWHRPYIALYEQQLKAIATNIANNWYSPQRATYQAAANTLRLPYWDWAKSGTVPSQIANSQITIVSQSTGQSQTIANPLFSHTTTGSLGNGISVGRNGGRTTYRSGTYVKDMSSQFSGLRRGVALLFNTPNVCWNVFATYDSSERSSCGASSVNSLEGVHNTVHNTICGTMCNLDASAFDPIFWLHHANVDRIGALWQALNPNTRQPTTRSSSGNFVWDSGSQRGDTFSYMPFRTQNTGTAWWTPAMSYDVRMSGYTYPEIADRPSVSTLQSRLNNIYGNGRSQQAVSTNAKRDDEFLALEERQASANLITPPSQAALAPFRASLINVNGSYSEYSAEVTIRKSVAPGESFNLHLFFGDVDVSRIANSDYLDASNRVGGISVSQASSTNGANAAQGVVPITDALLNTLIAGGIKDLKPSTVRQYVRAKLVWRLVTASGKDIGGTKARGNGLAIRVRRTVVTPDGGAQAVPVVAAPEALVDTTDNTKAAPLPAGVAASSVSSAAPASTGTSSVSSSAAASSTATADDAESTA
ncbi:Tyrosinase [Fulvia fulva]|nr:Tyrosinase [Fulvia fulva]KAK4618780.1 Tyrosinase [Fulvia fulva]WPV17784.1 Tyrosinase [Fulvia fulva]WPV33569.1 Tyrosinase [Fulvia fulva]